MSNHAPLLLRIVSVLLLAACGEEAAIAPCLDLAEVRRYGTMDDTKSDGIAPGVLGSISGVVAAPNGDVYVLDRATYRVVAFDSTGAARTVVGREGEGPGEFILPLHLAATDEGFSVLDYELMRISEFDWSGRFVRMTRTKFPRSPWRHVVRNDTAWIGYNVGASADRAFDIVLLRTGDAIPGPGLAPEDRPFRAGMGITFTSNGDLLVNTARPGVWMQLSGGVWTRRGSPRFPDDAPPRDEQVGPLNYRFVPAQHVTSGLAAIGDSLVLQGTFGYSKPFDWNDPPTRDEGVRALEVYYSDGRPMTSLPLPAGAETSGLTSDAPTGRIFLPVTEPFPQVIEYRLVECSGTRS